MLDGNSIYRYENINMSFTVLDKEQKVRFSPVVEFDEDLFVFLARFYKAKEIGEKNKKICQKGDTQYYGIASLLLNIYARKNLYTTPCASIASATFSNPAILAPTT